MLHTKPQLILFDVYDTLLDMDDVKRRINAALDSRRGYQYWLDLLTQYCLLDNCTGQFHDFTAISKATLQLCGKSMGVQVTDSHIDDILHWMRYLPLREGMREVLSKLYDLGYRLAALTNAPEDVIAERMERTGLVSYFDGVLSAGSVKKFKPAKEVYQWAAGKLGVATEHCLMVTTHAWDVVGAQSTGMMAAYIRRPQQMMYPLAPSPALEITGAVQLIDALQAVAG